MDCYLAILPTYACNFNCSFCLEKKSKKLLDLDILKRRLSEIPYPIKHYSILGGEVGLLEDSYLNDLLDILEGKEVSFITNLSTIKNQFLDKRYGLNVSYDFDSRPQHKLVLNNILKLDRPFTIMTVVTPDLLKRSQNFIINFYNSFHNLEKVQFQFILTSTEKEYGYYYEFLKFLREVQDNPRTKFNVSPQSSIIGLAIDPDGNYTFTAGPMHGYFGDICYSDIKDVTKIYESSCRAIQNCNYCIYCEKCIKVRFDSDVLPKKKECFSGVYLR